MKVSFSEKQVIAIEVVGCSLVIGAALAAITASAALFGYSQFRVNQLSKAHAFDQFVAANTELLSNYINVDKQLAFVDYMRELKELAGPQSNSWYTWQWQEWWATNAPPNGITAYLKNNPDQLPSLFNQLTWTSLDQLSTTHAELLTQLNALSAQLDNLNPKFVQRALEQMMRAKAKPW